MKSAFIMTELILLFLFYKYSIALASTSMEVYGKEVVL